MDATEPAGKAGILGDNAVVTAVSRIRQRSERQEDLQKLLGTFVEVGILPFLNNRNHQILFGRRGTGKTHVFRVLGSELGKEPGNTVVYIDARTLGSSSQFSDSTVPLKERCLSLFRDLLLEIYNGLLEHIVTCPSSAAEEALVEADRMAAAVTEPLLAFGSASIATTRSESSQTQAEAGIALARQPGIRMGIGAQKAEHEDVSTRIDVAAYDKVMFPDLSRKLARTLKLAETSLYVLLDEWSSLPHDIQPYLAEFLKRGVLPVAEATLKIASLEYRSVFSEEEGRMRLGFELGADIAVAPDLDDYYVFDRNPEHITDVYADVLHRHLSSELPHEYLEQKYSARDGRTLVGRLFTERKVFEELARASEGVIRDLINIFSVAFFDARRRERERIDKKAIVEAARHWFEQDKAKQLGEELRSVLQRIVDEVIGRRKARSFLMPRDLEQHPTIRRLFDARVLHHIQRGYADKDNPGMRYNIYTLDYGTYVDLLGTSKQPDAGFSEAQLSEDFVVPFDDKRSIRRIVLDRSILEPTANGHAQR